MKILRRRSRNFLNEVENANFHVYIAWENFLVQKGLKTIYKVLREVSADQEFVIHGETGMLAFKEK